MPARISVIGGGYAGRLCATRLARRGHRVTLVDPGPHRVQRIALHLHAVHGARVTAPLAPPLQRAGVEVIRDRAVRVRGTTVHLARGGRLEADRLVLAIGSQATRPAGEGAHEIGSLGGARRLRRALQQLSSGTVCIVGMGLTGIELAASLARARPELRVRMLGRQLAADVDARSEEQLRRRLAALGVELVEGVEVTAARPDGVELDGHVEPAELVVWCAGLCAASLAGDDQARLDGLGRFSVDATLHAGGGVYVAGDAAAVRGRAELGMTCAVALPMGAHAAEAVHADLTGAPVPEFRFAYVLRCIQLGGLHGLVVRTDAMGQPTGGFAGLPAGLVKQALYRYVLDVPTLELRTGRSLYTWPTPQEA